MKTTEAKFTRRFNTGEYEFEEFTLSAIVEDDETGSEVLIGLKKEVTHAFAGDVTKEEEENAKSNSSKNNDKNGKTTTKKAKGAADEGSDDDEASDNEASDDDNDSTEGDEDEAGDESDDGEEETKSSKGKAGAKSSKNAKDEGSKKTFKKKPQDYNRSIEAHKEIFSGVLRSINPDWKKSEDSKKKAKKVSEAVEGEEFLDGNGEVLDSFKALVKKKMK